MMRNYLPHVFTITAFLCAVQDGNDQAPDVSRLMSAEELGFVLFGPAVTYGYTILYYTDEVLYRIHGIKFGAMCQCPGWQLNFLRLCRCEPRTCLGVVVLCLTNETRQQDQQHQKNSNHRDSYRGNVATNADQPLQPRPAANKLSQQRLQYYDHLCQSCWPSPAGTTTTTAFGRDQQEAAVPHDGDEYCEGMTSTSCSSLF